MSTFTNIHQLATYVNETTPRNPENQASTIVPLPSSPMQECPNLDLSSYSYIQVSTDWVLDGPFFEMSGDAIKAALMLMAKAWHQVPAASLPADNDKLLARWSNMSMDEFQKIKSEVLTDWTLCDDGRWYCNYLVPLAKKIKKEREKNTAKNRQWKNKTRLWVPGSKSAPLTETGESPIDPDQSVTGHDLPKNKTKTENKIQTQNKSAAASDMLGSKADWPGFQEDHREQPGSEHAGVWLSEDRKDRWRATYPHVPASAYYNKIIWIRDKAKNKPALEELERLIANDNTTKAGDLAKAMIKAEAEAKAKAAKPYKPPLV